MPISAGSAAASADAGARKMPFVAAVATTKDGKAHRVKLRRVRRFTKSNIKKITRRIVKRGTRAVTDGLGCFYGVADAGCTHEAIVTRRLALTTLRKDSLMN